MHDDNVETQVQREPINRVDVGVGEKRNIETNEPRRALECEKRNP